MLGHFDLTKNNSDSNWPCVGQGFMRLGPQFNF